MRRIPVAWRFSTAAVIFLIAGFAAGVAADEIVAPQLGYSAQEPASVRSSFPVFWEVWNLASSRYVDRKAVRPTEMIDGAINGMLNSLGDAGHTRYLTPRDTKFEESTIRGRYEGVGIELRYQGTTATITGTLDGSPAQQAGLRHGDVITRVDGTLTSSLSLSQLTARIRGKPGTTVRLTIRRAGLGDEFDVTLRRSQITTPSVSWLLVPGTRVAQVRITNFSETTGQDLRQALDQAHRAGATGLVLDLRANFGGLVDQTLRAASEFLDQNTTVFIEQNRSGERTNRHTVHLDRRGAALNDPVVVLIDGGTASAAEILAGALQDNRRGRLVGETTIGTGTVLSTFRLRDGGSLLLGTQEWLTPKGTPIKGQGIKPDQLVTLPPSVVPLFPTEGKTLTPEEFGKRADQQLQAAVGALQGRS